ncbi:MAG TPA: UDP-N-acetylmuramate dehydrogenase [Pyrinomonadaceae bacterium]|nr:UDP-N-acetylmuramate dehydrogenase [Pyrinomonadaceae bacterium]
MANLNIQKEVLLAPFTTLGVGGPAKFYAAATSEKEIEDAVKYAADNSLELFVLGGGSNIVISDQGFDGLVLQVDLRGVKFSGDQVTVAAGEDWDTFVSQCINGDLAGLECLSGIPGFVGGTPVQNVGAYGQEVSETIETVRCFDRNTQEFVDLTNQECGFSYRTSLFNSTHRERYIVVSVTYLLNKKGSPKIEYKDLKEYFAGSVPSLGQTRDAVLKIRRAKSMVIDLNDPNSRSAGSFFKNPIISKETAIQIAERLGIEKMPQFPVDEDRIKIPAAWLIEQSGFKKGFRLGNAGISANHSLAIINLGGASASEIVALKDVIQIGVKEKFDISLTPEPIFVGF